MTRLRVLLSRVRGLFDWRRRETELHDEIQAHLDRLADEHVLRGMSPTDARLAARRDFGGVDQMKETYRDQCGLRFLDSISQDVRYAIRTLRRSPGFTFVAILMLALGIGVNATVFTVTNAVLFKGFPSVVRNDRVVYLSTNKGVSYPDFADWRDQAKSFEGLALVNGVDLSFSDKGALPEHMFAAAVTVNAFKVMGQRPIIGRDFAPSDGSPGAAPVAILSYGLWERRYAKDAAIIGQTVKIGGYAAGSIEVAGEPSSIGPATVIGVMAQGVSFPFTETLWVPLVPFPSLQKREARSLFFAFGRMVDGATIQSTRAEMDTIGRRLANAYPLTNQGVYPRVRTFAESFGGPNATVTYGAMWAAVAFVLVIACANVANLLLVRAITRSREMSVRIALGAGRWRIIRQLVIESVMLSAMGGGVGWWMATWGVRTYVLAQPRNRINFDYAMDSHVLGYLIAISIGTGLLFGLVPANRLSTLQPNATLNDGGRGTTGGRGRHLSALLVIGEMALTVMLLTGAGVMIRSFLKVYTADLGVNPANLLTINVNLLATKYPSAETQIAFYDRLRTRLEAIPGVESIAFANSGPTAGVGRISYELPGALLAEQRRATVSALTISAGYFRTLGATVLAGREFTDADGASELPVAIVNQRFATECWPGEDALGKRLRLFHGTTPDAWLTVVGVASNIMQNDSTRQVFDPLVYVPYRQQPRTRMVTVARTRVPPASLGTALWREIQATDAGLPSVDPPTPLAERVASTYQSRRLNGGLFLMFAAIALLLASIGLYAVVAHTVSQRTQEIGIRTALGATAGDILALVFTQGMRPVGIGVIVGLAAALMVTPVLKSQLVGISPSDPITYMGALATLIVVALLACLIPARRATRVDPLVALRHE